MSTFDEITFAKHFKILPSNVPKSGWQTKDLGNSMSCYHVQNDGLLIKKGFESKRLGISRNHQVNPKLQALIVMYTDGLELQLTIENGHVTGIHTEWKQNDNTDDWLEWSGQVDD